MQILMFADHQAETEVADRELRLALLAAGRDPELLFPEEFGATSAPPPGDVADEYGQLVWSVPEAGEWDLMQAALAGARKVSVRLPDDEGPMTAGGWI